MDRSAHRVVGRVHQELIVGGGDEALRELERIVGLDDGFGGIGEGAVADQDAEAAGRQITAVIGREG